MAEHTAYRMVLAPRIRVAAVLTNVAELAEWNPALLSATAPDRVAKPGSVYRVTTRIPGPATLRYAEISAERIVWILTVAGGVETGEWRLRDVALPDEPATLVTHTVRHSGPLLWALHRAMRPVPALRLDRLAARV